MEKQNRGENGEIMIESMLVLILTMFVLIFLISLGFLLYQKWNIQYIADDIAGKAAASYSYKDIALSDNQITAENMENRALYRYLFSEDSYNASVKERGEKYGLNMLRLTTFAKPVREEKIEISDAVTDSLARRHLTVKVTGTYKIPFGEGLEIMGMSSTRTFEASGAAECIDLIDYIGTVNYAKNCVALTGLNQLPGINAIDSWMKVIKHVFDK